MRIGILIVCIGAMIVLGCNSASNTEPPAVDAVKPATAKTLPPPAKQVQQRTTTTTNFEKAEMPWVDLGEVEKMVGKAPKKVIVDVYTNWCGPCKMMDRNTFASKEIVDLVEANFYPVKFNAEGGDEIKFKGKVHSNPQYDPAKSNRRNSKHELANFFNVRGYPTLVVLNEKMEIIEKIVGYKNPAQLKDALQKHMIAG